MTNIKAIIFDAANTLIYKPKFYDNFVNVLGNYGYNIEMDKFEENHKILSESFTFPDLTNEEFYNVFNTEVLLSLGIIPTNEILNDIFFSCKNLPWEAYKDTTNINNLGLPIFVFSNFSKKLRKILKSTFDHSFSDIIISEEIGVAKPNIEFYTKAIKKTGLNAENLLYVGDSLKLDVIPGLATNMKSYLIDRNGFYLTYENRFGSLEEIKELI